MISKEIQQTIMSRLSSNLLWLDQHMQEDINEKRFERYS